MPCCVIPSSTQSKAITSGFGCRQIGNRRLKHVQQPCPPQLLTVADWFAVGGPDFTKVQCLTCTVKLCPLPYQLPLFDTNISSFCLLEEPVICV